MAKELPESVIILIQDFIFLALLVLCYLFGLLVYKRIEGENKRKWVGTCIGALLIFYIFGSHFWHLALAIFGTAWIILNTNKKKCHYYVVIYISLYITVLRIYLIDCNRAIYTQFNGALMMMSGRLMGLAFEVHNSHKDPKDKRTHPEEHDDQPIDLTFMDIMHYSFCYIGILVGPYVRYRTYDDFIKLPFSKYADGAEYNKKIYFFPLFVMLFMMCDNIWPISYVYSDEFESRSYVYKILYTVILKRRFEFWICSALVVSECICTAAGMGAYPVEYNNKSTHGPTKDYDKCKKISSEEAKKLSYNFDTISNIDISTLLWSPWVTKIIMSWSKSVQYFLGMYVYKMFTKTGPFKSLRGVFTAIFSAFWHGLYIGFSISLIALPFYLLTEKIYLQFYKNMDGTKAKAFAIVMFVIRNYILSCAVDVPFMVLDFNDILKFYISIRFTPFIFWICFHLGGLLILNLYKKHIL